MGRDGSQQGRGIFHALAIDLGDDVTGFDAGLGRRFTVQDAGHQGTGGMFHAKGLGRVFIHVLDGHADPAAADLFAALDLFHDAGRHVAGDGKADPLPAGDDGRIDADDLTLHVQQRTPAVAGVDGGIRLQEVVKRTGMDITVLGRKDTGRDRVVQSKRIADGQQPLPYQQGVGIAELEERQILFGIDLEQGKVGVFVRSHDRGRQRGGLAVAFVQCHLDAVAVSHHMVVGHDVAVGRDDETGTTRHLFLRRTLSARIGTAEEFEKAVRSRRHATEHLAEEFLRTGSSRGGTLRTDVDDSRAAFGSQFTELRKAGRLGELRCREQDQCQHGREKVFNPHTGHTP